MAHSAYADHHYMMIKCSSLWKKQQFSLLCLCQINHIPAKKIVSELKIDTEKTLQYVYFTYKKLRKWRLSHAFIRFFDSILIAL